MFMQVLAKIGHRKFSGEIIFPFLNGKFNENLAADEARRAKYILQFLQCLYRFKVFLSASNVVQRHDVLLFFSLFEHILGLGGQNFSEMVTFFYFFISVMLCKYANELPSWMFSSHALLADDLQHLNSTQTKAVLL